MRRYFSMHIFEPMKSYPWKVLRVDREEYGHGVDLHIVIAPAPTLAVEFSFIRMKARWPWKT